MSDSIRTDNLKYEQARVQQQQEQERKMKGMKEQFHAEINRLVDNHNAIKEQLERAYMVDLSKHEDDYAEKITNTRISNAKRVEEENLKGEQEVEHVRNRYAEQIARYRENSEKQLEDLKKQTENSADNIRQNAKRRGAVKA